MLSWIWGKEVLQTKELKNVNDKTSDDKTSGDKTSEEKTTQTEIAGLKPLQDVTVPKPLIVSVTSTDSLSPAPDIVVCAGTASISLTLPQASSFPGKKYTVSNSANFSVILVPFDGDTIAYAASKTLTSRGLSTIIESDGIDNWIAN